MDKIIIRKHVNLYLPILFLLLIVHSCKPEGDSKNPAEYEDYITISSDQTPSVSPDGEWIAYFHKSLESPEPLAYKTGLYIMDKNGSNRRCLLEGNHFQPSWSPDGNWLVFSSGGVLQIISFEGDSLRTFIGIGDLPLFFPDWSKDGKLILFSSPYVEGGGGFICSTDFIQFRQIYDHYRLNAYPVKWFSNNQMVGCLYSKNWQYEEIFLIDTSLTNPIRLTTNKKSDRDPSFSPTQDYIVWSSNVQIYIMNSNGSNQKRLDYGQYPGWTPDGKYIVYSNASPDFTKEVIWKIDINGNNKTQLTF